MDSTQKLIILNKTAQSLRENMKQIDDIFKDNKDIGYFIWKINKMISKMHEAIFQIIKTEIVDEDFKKIVKQFEKQCEE